MAQQTRASVAELANDRFRRSQATWAAYLLLGYFGFLEAIPGPLLPELRQELHLSYGEAALHFSAFAAGVIVAGLLSTQASARMARSVVIWGGAAGMAAGGLALATGDRLAFTVAGAAAMGLCGTFLLVALFAALAQEHETGRTQAVTEGSAVYSLGGCLAPLAVGGALWAGLSWRLPVFAAVGLLGVLAARFIRVRPPARVETTRHRRGPRLPALFWAYWAALMLGVSAEFCVKYWGTEYLHQVRGLDTGAAATLMGLYLGVVLGGHVGGSAIARTVSSDRLLVVAAACALAGVLVFWRAPGPTLAAAGLSLAGLGIANLYPLALACGLDLVPAQPDVVTARAETGSGLAILVAPFALGALADHLGSLQAAFAVVPALLAAFGAIALAVGLGRRRYAPAP